MLVGIGNVGLGGFGGGRLGLGGFKLGRFGFSKGGLSTDEGLSSGGGAFETAGVGDAIAVSGFTSGILVGSARVGGLVAGNARVAGMVAGSATVCCAKAASGWFAGAVCVMPRVRQLAVLTGLGCLSTALAG